jgi:hypothetical protein
LRSHDASFHLTSLSPRTKAALKAAKARGVKLGRHGAEALAFSVSRRGSPEGEEARIEQPLGNIDSMATELTKRKVKLREAERGTRSEINPASSSATFAIVISTNLPSHR